VKGQETNCQYQGDNVATLKDALEQAVFNFVYQPPQCWTTVDNTDQYDLECVKNILRDWANTTDRRSNNTICFDYIYPSVECDGFGGEPGQCIKNWINRKSDAQAAADAVCPVGGISGSETAETGSSGGMMLYAIIAGVLLLAIAIALFVRSRRNNSGAGAASTTGKDTRDQVAFSNPLYDDASRGQAMANPLYDEGTLAGADEALYDEPAFNSSALAKSKANPLYNSMDNVAGEAYEELGADMDETAPEGGYLDVSPEEEAGAQDEHLDE
jgi:hypothetical protein